MSYEGTGMPDTDAQEKTPQAEREKRIDSISVVAGLLFIAIAVLALADRFWTDIDPVLVAGGAVIAVGVAIAVGVIRRRVGRRD